MQHYIRTVTGQTIILQEKDILISQLILMLGKFHIHKKKNGRFQFSSSVNFAPTFDACQSKLTALFSHHPKSCQNIHEHDITFQVLTVITEKNKYKKVTFLKKKNCGLLKVMRLHYLSFLSRYSCFFLETPASSVFSLYH